MNISFCDLSILRSGDIKALDHISCELDFCMFPRIAVLGANGAGKSTLLAAVLNLVPASSGEIRLNDIPITSMKQRELRTRIGMIFQNADDQLFSQTVYDDIAFGPNHLMLSPDEVRSRVDEVLQSLEIEDLAHRNISCLSGGEKRRIALAGVLAMRPELVLLDEPTAMLDPRGTRELADYLCGIPSCQLIATHDLAFAEKVCSRAIILRDGKLIAFDDIGPLLRDEALLISCSLL